MSNTDKLTAFFVRAAVADELAERDRDCNLVVRDLAVLR